MQINVIIVKKSTQNDLIKEIKEYWDEISQLRIGMSSKNMRV